jgi:ribosomal protein L29
MKSKEIVTMSTDELKNKLTELRQGLIKENAQVATGTIPKNPGNLRIAKKTIARILLALGQREAGKKA